MKQYTPNVAEQVFTAAKYFYQMAEHFYAMYHTSKKEDHIAAFHVYKMKAAEAEKYGELMVQDAIKGTIGFAPEWVQDNFIALNPATINNEINKCKAFNQGDISEESIIEVEVIESNNEPANKKTKEELRNEEIQILNNKKNARDKEPPFITSLRSEMFDLITKGETTALANLLANFHFKWDDYDTDRAFRFISLFADQYKIKEPAKKLKDANVTNKIRILKTQELNRKKKVFSKEYYTKFGIKPTFQQLSLIKLSKEEADKIEEKANEWSVNKIPTDKYIHAAYIVRGPNNNVIEVGYLKRHPHRLMELYKGNKFKCYLNDVLKWRTIFTLKDKEYQCLKNNNPLRK